MSFAALLALLLAAPPALGQEAVLEIDLSKKATAEREGVEIENYQFTGDAEDGLLSLKPYSQSLLEQQRHVRGTVSTTFDGRDGWYTVLVQYQDEGDGTSSFELRVNGEAVRGWRADSIFATYLATERIEHVQLSKGDQLQVMGEVGGTEYARLRRIAVLPGDAPAGADEPVEIPQRDWSMDLVMLGDYGDYPDPARLIPAPQGGWDKGRETVFYFRADKPGTFTTYATPPSGGQKARGSFAFRKLPNDATEPADDLEADGSYESPQEGEPALLEFQVPESGLYELHVQGGIKEVTHALTRRIGSHAAGQGFFWVPDDTTAIRLTGNVNGRYVTHAAVKDPTGDIVWQGEIADDGERVIRIPADQRGKPWYIEYSAVGGTSLRIEGVPPYLAQHRAHLLLPREALGDRTARNNQQQSSQRAATENAGRPGIDKAATSADAPTLTLVENSKPRARIIAPADRTTPAGEAAALLQRYIEQISGAELPVVQQQRAAMDKSAVQIHVGTPKDFPDVALPAGFDKLNDAGFVLKTERWGDAQGEQDDADATGGRLLVIGRTPEAVQHAAATLLRRLGCRWYYPAPSWHVIPRAETITVALDDLNEPSFIRRTIGYRSRDRGRFQKWAVYNRLGSTIDGAIHHSYASFVPPGLYKEHPEYFALKDTDGDGIGDTRTPNQPCTTHPEVVKMFKEKAVQRFEQNPDLEMLPVSPNDGTPNMCRCERCREVGSYSDTMWLIAHQVANAVDEKFDGKKISIMAYGRPSPPTTLDMPRDERLVAELATAYLNNVSLDEMLAGWPEDVGMVTIYDYWAIPQWGSNQPGGHFNVEEARQDVPYYHREGARGLTGEAAGSWGSTGLAIYVATQLMWDVDADVDAIVDRYYRECFGNAADAVRAYESRWQQGAEFNDRTLKLALLDLQRGLQQAKHWPEKRRVAGLALYMHALKVRRDFAQLGEKERERSAEQIAQMVEAGDSFLWRFRAAGLYHMSHGIGGVTQDGFAWFTLEDVEQLIAQDLEDLKAAPAVEMRFDYSHDLAALPASTPGMESQPSEEGSQPSEPRMLPGRSHVIIQADPQAPVRVSVHQTNSPNAPVQVTVSLVPYAPGSRAADAPGPVDERTLEFSESGAQTVSLTPKQAGLYRIDFGGQKYRYRIQSSQRWVIDLSRGAKPETWLAARDAPWYFYVPSDVELFELYGSGGNEKPLRLRVFDANGEMAEDKTVTRAGRVQVRVPEAKRGAVWSFRMNYFIGLYGNWIDGVPPYISPSPDKLLVPREVIAE